MSSYGGDRVIYAAVALLFVISSAASALFVFAERSVTDMVVEVRIDGELERVVEITRDGLGRGGGAQIVTISNDLGRNEFEIADGMVRMTSSDCGGGDCLRMPPVSRSGGVIVCLPHRLTLRVVGRSGGLDDVSY